MSDYEYGCDEDDEDEEVELPKKRVKPGKPYANFNNWGGYDEEEYEAFEMNLEYTKLDNPVMTILLTLIIGLIVIFVLFGSGIIVVVK